MDMKTIDAYEEKYKYELPQKLRGEQYAKSGNSNYRSSNY
jgi:hypothetical protein